LDNIKFVKVGKKNPYATRRHWPNKIEMKQQILNLYAGIPNSNSCITHIIRFIMEKKRGKVMEKYEMKIYKDVLFFKYYEMAETVEEAEQQAEEVKRVLSQPGVTKFLNDNSAIHNSKPEVNVVWGELMSWIGSNVEKTGTIATNEAWKNQLNRLSKSAGAYDSLRAFSSLEESLEFMGIPDFKM
jgi:hypothetical protein